MQCTQCGTEQETLACEDCESCLDCQCVCVEEGDDKEVEKKDEEEEYGERGYE